MKARIFPALLLGMLSAPLFAKLDKPAALRAGEEVYKETCAACHETGVAHAPRLKDTKAWAPLIAEGQHVLTAHAWVGVRAMPAMGGNPKLKLAEFAGAVAWMAGQSGGNWQVPDAALLRKISREAEKRLEKTISDAQKMKAELHRMGLAPNKP